MKRIARAAIPSEIRAAGFGAWEWPGTPIGKPKTRHHAPQKPQKEKTVLNPTSYNVIIESQGHIRRDRAEALAVRNGLNPGSRLATSRLPYAPDGVPFEIMEPAPLGEAAGPTGVAEPVAS